MNLAQSPKGWKTLFHVSLAQDEKTCNEIRPLQSSPNISDVIQNGTNSSKLIDQNSTSEGQQLDHSSRLPNIQRPFSPSHFLSQQGNSLMTGLQSGEVYNSQNLSSSNSGIPNLVGYWPATPLQTESRSDSHVSQQHPYLLFQQQSLSPPNTRFDQYSYLPQVTTQFPLSVCSSYLSQRNQNSSFGMNRQGQSTDKFPSLPPLTSPSLYQLHDNNNLINYQSYLQLPPLHTNYPSLGSVPYNSGEYFSYYTNNQSVFSDGISGNDLASQPYTQVLSRNYSLPSTKQLGSTESLPSVRSTKTSNSFSSRPFKCDQCFQSFNRNHDLKRHKRIHLAVKPFPCPSCEKSFSRKDALKRHILVKGCIG